MRFWSLWFSLFINLSNYTATTNLQDYSDYNYEGMSAQSASNLLQMF